MFIADTLSRAFLENETETDSVHLENINIVNLIPISADRLNETREETVKDDILQNPNKVKRSGWSNNIRHVTHNIRPHFHIRDELTVENGTIFK